MNNHLTENNLFKIIIGITHWVIIAYGWQKGKQSYKECEGRIFYYNMPGLWLPMKQYNVNTDLN